MGGDSTPETDQRQFWQMAVEAWQDALAVCLLLASWSSWCRCVRSVGWLGGLFIRVFSHKGDKWPVFEDTQAGERGTPSSLGAESMFSGKKRKIFLYKSLF